MLRTCSLVSCTSKYDEGKSELDWNGESTRRRGGRRAVSLQRSKREYGQRNKSGEEEQQQKQQSSTSERFQSSNTKWEWKFEGDEYEDDEDDEDDEEDGEWSLDIRVALGLFGLGLPVLFVGVPWLVGHPMYLTMVLAVGPLVQRVFSFAAELWRSTSTFSSRSKRYRKSGYRDIDYKFRRARKSVEKEEENIDEAEENSWEVEGEKEQKVMGGWAELEEDREKMIQRTRRFTSARMKRFKRKHLPLFWRVVLAVFPFLRSWGGFV